MCPLYDRGVTDADDHGCAEASPEPTLPPARARRRRWWVLAAVLAVVVVPAAWLAVDVLVLRGALTDAAAGLSRVKESAEAGDVPAARAHLDEAEGAVGRVDRHARSWTLGLARTVPAVRADIDAVRTVSAGVVRLAEDAMPGLLDALEVVDPSTILGEGGRIDVAALESVQGTVLGADAMIGEVRASLDTIDATRLRPVVAGPVTELREQLSSVAAQTVTAARAVSLLPSMLGADGERHYLVLVQNNAEFRALGGIPGAAMLVRVVDGAVEIVEHASTSDFGEFAEPVLPLTTDEEAIFGAELGRYIQDVTFTPDFPRAAELAREMWLQRRGLEVDGVLAVDPVVLRGLVEATGPVELEDGTVLAADDVIPVLLNRVYFDITDPAAQDAFFADVASRVFGAFTSGAVDGGGVFGALTASAREGRVLVWSAHEAEQAQLSGTVLAGELEGSVGSRPVVGVFLNDGSAAKMSYYLDTEVGVETLECRADGSRLMRVSLRMANTAPDPATLPPYVTGAVLEPGQVRTNFLIYAPAGAVIEQVLLDGTAEGVASFEHHGLAVAGWSARLDPGAARLVEADLVVPAELDGELILRSTPAARGRSVQVTGGICEGVS